MIKKAFSEWLRALLYVLSGFIPGAFFVILYVLVLSYF